MDIAISKLNTYLIEFQNHLEKRITENAGEQADLKKVIPINQNTLPTDSAKEIIEQVHTVVNFAAQQQDIAYKRLAETSDNTHTQLNQIYNQGHNQANHWFLFGIIAASVGFLVIIIGAIVTMIFANLSGIITSIASIIPGAISLLFFQQAKVANKRVDDFYNKLTELEWIDKATQLTFTTDNKAQDNYKELIIHRLLRLKD